ncbi:MAG TPA: ferredoxin [Firmicutes bacterium]|nr:ferredoxin [Bacillota bacterium]
MKQQYIKNVVSLDLNVEKCIGCGRCREVCPHHVFKMENRKALIQNRDGCMECGACARNCPAEAITVRAGVGCAAAIVMGKLRGSAPYCGDSDEPNKQCCG